MPVPTPMNEPRLAVVRKNAMRKNDVTARALRQRFCSAGVYVTSVVSAPGSGKTSLFEHTLADLEPSYNVAALVGDLATDLDALRLAETGVPVRQITTGQTCHLDADMIEHALDGWTLRGLEFLLIENVGNLVCPASYDLGENLRIVAVSVTEGEDKPLKYPTIFDGSDLAVITKMDLASAAGFDADEFYRNIERIRPGMPVFETSAKTGAGMNAYVKFLEDRRRDWHEANHPAPPARHAPAVSLSSLHGPV